jgi:CubicO group peptidase (beta-lactamase class C family)
MDDASAKPSGFDAAILAQTPGVLRSVIDSGDLSGAVTLIWRKGEIAQVNVLGQRDIARSAPMERDTLFRIASMTKPVTSVAALMLMEEGRLALADPITRWAPEFADMRVLTSPMGPIEDTYPSPRDITIEDLLTHRAGLAYGFTSIGPIAHAHQKALGDVLNTDTGPDAWMQALASLPLSYRPGERFHYSHATDVLGFIVGRIAGGSFRDFLIERILAPLAMTDTDFYIPPAKRDREAVVYRLDEESGRLEPVPFRQYDAPPAFCGGGGGLISTADDYLRFAHAAWAGRGRRRAPAKGRNGAADDHQSPHSASARNHLHGHAVLGRPGFRLGPFGNHGSRKAGVDGRRLERRLWLARRLWHLVAGRSGPGHGNPLHDPELHPAGTRGRDAAGHGPAHGRAHRPADVPEAGLRRA